MSVMTLVQSEKPPVKDVVMRPICPFEGGVRLGWRLLDGFYK
jgi:hypothetical protein